MTGARDSLPVEDVFRAAQRIREHARRTPVATSRILDQRVAAEVFLKLENLQRAGAFKFRGACNSVLSLSQEECERGVMAASSGNHAQALALAASLRGTSAVILMPADTPESKLEAARSYGAEVILFDRYRDDRDELTEAVRRERNLVLVHSHDDARVIAGAGTVALEMLEEVGRVDTIVVPVGGGGLLAGCATAAKALDPSVRVLGIEPEGARPLARSLEAGHPITVGVQETIADGQQLASPGPFAFQVIKSLVDDVLAVSDTAIVEAMRFLFERMKIVAEPSGASALAAVLSGQITPAGARIGVVVSGGNVSVDRFARVMGRAA